MRSLSRYLPLHLVNAREDRGDIQGKQGAQHRRRKARRAERQRVCCQGWKPRRCDHCDLFSPATNSVSALGSGEAPTEPACVSDAVGDLAARQRFRAARTRRRGPSMPLCCRWLATATVGPTCRSELAGDCCVCPLVLSTCSLRGRSC